MVNNIKEGYFQNWEIRRQKQKITIKPIKKNYKKIANVLKKSLKKYMKNYYYKSKIC